MMKQLKIAASLFLAFGLMSACQFNQSVSKNLKNGATSRGDGLGVEEITMQVSGKAAEQNSFVFGETVKVTFNDISGLANEAGMTYPGMALFIVKNEQDTVLAEPDLLPDMANGTDLSPLQLEAFFRASLPYREEEQYRLHVNIWDRKGEGTFHYELPFEVKASDLLDIQAQGLNYSSIFLWNQSSQQPLLDAQVKQDEELVLIMEGLEGFEQKEGKVFPVCSIEITDQSGRKILANPNVISQYEASGVPVEQLAESQLPVTITFSPGEIENPCILQARLSDQNSEKEIAVKGEITVVD